MKNSPSKENNRLAFFLLIGVTTIALASIFIAKQRAEDQEVTRKYAGEVRGIENKTSACDVLGLETGVETSVPAGDSYAAYYNETRLAVVGTAVLPGTSESQIIEAAKLPSGKSVHLFRLGYGEEPNVFEAADAIRKISTIIEVTSNLGVDIQVMPVNEPRTELAWKYGDNAPIDGSKWLKEVVDGLKANDNPEISNTVDYLVFPAFNYHNPNNANYISEFTGNYFGDGNGQLAGSASDFANFGLSIQYDTESAGHADNFATMFAKYEQILADKGITDVKYTIFGANQINQAPDIDGYAENLLGFVNANLDKIDGVYIFSPWGWRGSNSGNENLSISSEVWAYLFEQCSARTAETTSDYSCKLSAVSDYPSLESCERVNTTPSGQARGKYDDVFAGVSMKSNDLGGYSARAVITQQITGFSLLNWMGSSNLYDTADYPGTNENPFLPPCAFDKQMSSQFNLAAQFSGLVKITHENGEVSDYQMPALGNSLACMIYWALNSEESMSLRELDSRFPPYNSIDATNSSAFTQEITGPIPEGGSKLTISELTGDEYRCGGVINHVNNTDNLIGPEIIIYDDMIEFDRQGYLDAVSEGRIDASGGASSSYLKIDGNTVAQTVATEKIEIPGAGQALAQMYKEELLDNPWYGRYQIIHKDQSGIIVKTEKKLYDGTNFKGDYKQPLSTDASCTQYELIDGSLSLAPVTENLRGITGKSIGAADHYIPWLGQIVNMSKRSSLIFTDTIEDDYLNSRKDELKLMTTFLNLSSESQIITKVQDTLGNPSNIFTCSDLGDLADSIENNSNMSEQKRELLIRLINTTDCLGTKYQVDPLNQWLCQNDLLTAKYCINECIPMEDIPVSDRELGNVNLIWPVTSRNITQYYGVTPYLSANAAIHPGIDIGTPVNSVLLAVADGKVIYARNPGETVTIGNGLYQDSSYGGLIVIDHGDFHSVYAHLNSVSVAISDTVLQGDQIGYTGNSGNSTGPHLHFELRYEGCYDYDGLDCTVDPLAYLDENEYTGSGDRFMGLEVCETLEGEEGYQSARILEIAQEAVSTEGIFEYGNVGEMQQKLINTCPIQISTCDESCKNKIKNWVVKLANKNIDYLGASYNEIDYYSIPEINQFMDEMYKEAHDDIKFQLLVSIWLSENGMNPTFKNKGFKSDVFGCGVYCGTPPQNFDEELACVTRKLDGCSMLYEFNPERPGEYLQKYGPIETNPGFSFEVLLVLDRLAQIQGVSSYRTDNGQCIMDLYDPVPIDLEWVVDLVNNT
ncbi:M23 family metallopeptidase [Candidatus Dojkabacteria bacterium]|nr:M23 family metallopeptidase [Candidatus Dojkabacteria bacterium]